MNESFHANTFEVKKKRKIPEVSFKKSKKRLKIGEEQWGLANCMAAYFRKAGGSLCF